MIDRHALSRLSFLVLIGGLSLAPVPAAEAHWYGSVHAGARFLDNADSTDSLAGGSIVGTTSFDTGYAISGVIGCAFQHLRVEGEIACRSNDLNDVSVQSINVGSSVITVAATLADEADVSALSVMANALCDFDIATLWVPFVLASVGRRRRSTAPGAKIPNLLEFSWLRDAEGYRVIPVEKKTSGGTADLVMPISGRQIRYHPLDEHAALFCEFAATEQNADGVVAFANRFGLLRGYSENPEDNWRSAPDDLDFWIAQIDIMKDAVAEWGRERISGRISDTIEIFNGLENVWSDCLPVVTLRLNPGADSARPHLSLKPFSLLSAMWAQFAQTVASGARLRQCKVCPNWIVFGTGTGRRRTAHYCSDRCRKVAHRRRQNSGYPRRLGGGKNPHYIRA